MFFSAEKNNPAELYNKYVYPAIDSEMGEIERVADTFEKERKDGFVHDFLENAKKTELTNLDEKTWSILDNTESYEIKAGDWDKVKKYSETKKIKRDWEKLRKNIENNVSLDAPMIVKMGNVFHLVSGNTRLMVSRALGVTPKVLIVEM